MKIYIFLPKMQWNVFIFVQFWLCSINKIAFFSLYSPVNNYSITKLVDYYLINQLITINLINRFTPTII